MSVSNEFPSVSISSDLQATEISRPLDLTFGESIEVFATRILKSWKIPDQQPKTELVELRSVIMLCGEERDMFKITNDHIQNVVTRMKKEEVHNYRVQCYPVPLFKSNVNGKIIYELRVNLYLNQ